MTSDFDWLGIYGVKPCMEGMSRTEITDRLSSRLETLVLARRNSWACWASEVKLPPSGERRVDYVDFCPHPTISCTSIGAVERGTFTFYEVKSCMADLKSGHGTTFDGDVNWLVCPVELVEEMRQKQIYVSAGILAWGKDKRGREKFVKIRKFDADGNGYNYRKHAASVLLYAMTRAGIRYSRTSEGYDGE